VLSKALKLQQENEDRKNELVVNNLEKRVKELESCWNHASSPKVLQEETASAKAAYT
jgi:hypothetical protein